MVKLNPGRSVPAIREGGETDGYYLNESCTIMRYICDKYLLDEHWYPRSLRRRAMVNAYLDGHHADVRGPIAGWFFRFAFLPAVGTPVPTEELKEWEEKMQGAM